jgi:hypothetical protein
VVADGDTTGFIRFRGYSAAAAGYLENAVIRATIDGTPDSGGDTTDMPGRLEFLTTTEGAGSAGIRMTIKNDGNVAIGSHTPTSKLHLDSGNATGSDIQFTAGTTTGVTSTDGSVIGVDTTGAFYLSNRENSGIKIFSGASVNTAVDINSSGTVAIKGTTTNDNASAGNVGEYIENVNSASSTNMPATGTFGVDQSITLTAGDWDITAMLLVFQNSATVSIAPDMFIGTVAGNDVTNRLLGVNYCNGDNTTGSGPSTTWSLSVPSYRVSISATTTYYLKGKISYSAGTPQYRYRISARRVR